MLAEVLEPLGASARDVHLRPDGARRERRQRARAARPAAGPRPDRTLRTDRHMSGEGGSVSDDATDRRRRRDRPRSDADPSPSRCSTAMPWPARSLAAFGSDITAVPGRCAHCGAVSVVAQLRAYVRAPGASCAARPATASCSGSSRPTTRPTRRPRGGVPAVRAPLTAPRRRGRLQPVDKKAVLDPEQDTAATATHTSRRTLRGARARPPRRASQ